MSDDDATSAALSIIGGGIPIPGGGSYVDNYVLAGVLALNLVSSTTGTAVGLSTDLHEGMMDRFRTLPMWRSAILVGRSLADLLTALLCALIVALTGLAVGWRPTSSAASVIGGFALILFFAYAIQWVAGCMGLNSKDPKTASSLGFILLLPLTFVSNALVPTQHIRAGSRRSPTGTCQRGRCRDLRALGKPEPIRDDPRLADAAPDTSRTDLVGSDPRRGSPGGNPHIQTQNHGVTDRAGREDGPPTGRSSDPALNRHDTSRIRPHQLCKATGPQPLLLLQLGIVVDRNRGSSLLARMGPAA
jgi:ABC-2 type transporter